MLPGGYAEVHIKLPAASDSVRLPVNTLIFRADGLQVATVDANGNQALLKSVTMGRDFGNEVEISAGIAPDEQVIVNPPDSLSNGRAGASSYRKRKKTSSKKVPSQRMQKNHETALADSMLYAPPARWRPIITAPTCPFPKAYKEAAGDWLPATPENADADRGPWWQAYKDDDLNALEDKVTSANQDLKATLARYEEARAAAAVARAGLFPDHHRQCRCQPPAPVAQCCQCVAGAQYNDYWPAAISPMKSMYGAACAMR